MTTASPILFSTPMVRALLDGRKSMTRRTVKQQERLRMGTDVLIEGDHRPEYLNEYGSWQQWVPNAKTMRCPYGVPGNLLWVRETFLPDPPADHSSWEDEGIATYVSWSGCGGALGDIPQALRTPSHVLYRATWKTEHKWQWRPAIHMPRWASRLTLEITDVRVERLQDISEEDAIAEGVEFETADPPFWYVPGIWPHSLTAVGIEEPGAKHASRCYAKLWNHINGAGSWDANPWVWVLTFKVHHANVDAVLAQRAEVAA